MSLITTLSGLFALTFLLRWLSTKNETRKHPPGPFALPIIGNIHQLTRRPWRQFAEWSRVHQSPILRINIAGQIAIVLNTHKAATDLLEHRSSIYSDRPTTNYVTSELLTGGMVFPFLHTDLAKRMRRGAYEALNNNLPEKFFPLIQTESTILTHNLLHTPHLHTAHIQRTSASFALSLVYGRPPLSSSHDAAIAQILHFSERIVQSSAPGVFLVNTYYFSWMRYLPAWMTPWRSFAEECFERDSAAFEALYADAEKRLAEGDGERTLAASITRDKNKFKFSRREEVWLCASVLAAATETTTSATSWFLTLMTLHPSIQQKAQEELDRVVGRDRLPTMRDEGSLHYVRAVMREVVRWKSVGPLGVPHAVQQDDVYEGYFLPKGTTILANIWAIHRDTSTFGSDADQFRPERHLTADGKLDISVFKDTQNEGHVSFGFGRRFCVGKTVANHSMFLQLACILWAFTLSPGKDEEGNVVVPDADDEVVDGIVVSPRPVPITFKPRFSGVREIIEHSMSRVEDES